MTRPLSRRAWLSGAAGLALASCDRVAQAPVAMSGLAAVEQFTEAAQRRLVGGHVLAREYPESAISPDFRANGTTNPDNPDYQAHRANGFATWRLEIGGLVERPLSLSLADLRMAPSRTQITRHDCVEGWSCIAKWKGARLGPLIDRAGLKSQARYLAFFCADALELTFDGTGDYYETISVVDAYHPQTLLAYEMNDRTLPMEHGAPIRLRLERQLGYKMAKYVMRIEAIESFDHLGRGKGGYWEDRGYQWYAGI